MWPFKKEQPPILIYNYIISYQDNQCLTVAKLIQDKLNQFCEAVISWNKNESPYKNLISKVVQGVATYSPESHQVDVVITGGERPIMWRGDSEKFLSANVSYRELISDKEGIKWH